MGGRSKQFQLERWRSDFTYQKVPRSNKITICPFEPPPPKETTRVMWQPDVGPQILHFVANALHGCGPNPHSSRARELVIASSQAYTMLGLCNGRHAHLRNGLAELDMDLKTQRDMWHQGRAKFADIFRRSLESLWIRHLIYYERSYLLSGSPERLATTEECANIHLIIGEVLRSPEFRCWSEAKVFLRGKDAAFYKRVNELCKERLGIATLYKVYRVFFTEESLKALDAFILKQEQLGRHKASVNEASYRWHLLRFPEAQGAVDMVIPVLSPPQEESDDERHS